MPVARCQAILFDLDGVLVDSRRSIETLWRLWAASRGLDAEPFLRVAHGRRTADTIRLVAPELDAAAEAAALEAQEEVAGEAGAQGAQHAAPQQAVPGAVALLEQLPAVRWAVVTSRTRGLATLRLGTAGLPAPAVLVAAEDVARGKPDPEGYLLAAHRLGARPADCIVVEDSPAGVAAGRAAGMRVIAVLTTHPADSLLEADARLAALADLRLRRGAPASGGLVLEY